MGKATAAIGSSAFFLLAPGVVAGLMPWWLTGWQAKQLQPVVVVLRVVGVMLIVAGGAVLVHAFARFVVEGVGTPAPIAPTRRLVIDGPYRYVRTA